jgi:hypothetical protein
MLVEAGAPGGEGLQVGCAGDRISVASERVCAELVGDDE